MNNRERKEPPCDIFSAQKSSDNFLINIKDLPKEEVLLALFNNVYKKSAASHQTWRSIVNLYWRSGKKVPIGTDPLTKYEAEDILNKAIPERRKIDYVGAVKFQIDFSEDIIETREYDEEHETGASPQIKSAYDCISELRANMVLERKKRTEEKDKEKNANDQLGKILGHKNCRISKMLFLGVTVFFKPEESYEKTLEHAKKLTEIGLSVKVGKESRLLNGLVTALGELDLLDPIEIVYEKLSKHCSQLDAEGPKKNPIVKLTQ